MEKNKFIVIVIFVCFGIVLAGGIVGYNLGKLRDNRDSERLNEFRRQTGAAVGFVEWVDSGLGDVQTGLAEIKGDLTGNAGDLREFAQRLFKVAGKVKEMEDSLDSLRGRVRSFLNDYNNSIDPVNQAD